MKKIGIVISAGHGAGWSTENGIECALDQSLANLIESGANSGDVFAYAANKFPHARLSAAGNLEVVWIDEGTKFYVKEYDGLETVVTEHDMVVATDSEFFGGNDE